MISTNGNFDRGFLLALIAIEALLSFTFYNREIAWYPPQNFDQTVFLTETYRLQELTLSHGLGQLWKALWSRGHPNGVALPIEGAISGLLLGGARLPQLCVLFFAFAALQIVAFYTAQAVWGGRVYGYSALGLILCQGTPWFWAGGLFDFRLDFIAYCLFGIWACAAIRSELFLNRTWSIGCGIIGALLVLNRFLTVIYLAGVCIGFGLICLAVAIIRRKTADLPRRMWRRIANLGVSVCVLSAVVAPILILNRAAIKAYYVIGHGISDERFIRAREFGIVGLADHLLWYPRSILSDHWGSTFLLGSAIAISSGLIARFLHGSKEADKTGQSVRTETLPLQVVFLLGAILGPLIVLTADISKSPVVGGIVGVPAILLVIALTAGLLPESREIGPAAVRGFFVACSLVIFSLGILNDFQHLIRHLPEHARRRDLSQLAQLDKWLVDYASDHDWHKPTISFDVISGWLNSTAITASGYEQSGKLVEFQTMLGAGIMGVAQPAALSMIAKSDFVILTTLPKAGIYPFYLQIAQYWDDLKNWADANMIVARQVPFDNFTATIYIRPTATISGLFGRLDYR